MKKIAILIPCYNEEITIRKVICDVKKEIPEGIIYLGNNNCTDKTVDIAKQENVNIIEEKKRGKSNMVRTMFEKIDSDYYVLIDGDDAFYISDVVKCIEIMKNENVDLLIGDRLSNYKNCNKTRIYSLGNWLANTIINFRYKSDIKDVMSGLRVISKDFVKNFEIKSTGFELETEMTVFAIKNNYKIKNVPIDCKARPKGSKSKLRTVRDGIKISKAVLKM